MFVYFILKELISLGLRFNIYFTTHSINLSISGFGINFQDFKNARKSLTILILQGSGTRATAAGAPGLQNGPEQGACGRALSEVSAQSVQESAVFEWGLKCSSDSHKGLAPPKGPC